MDEIKELAYTYYQNETIYYPDEFEDDYKYFNLLKRQLNKISRENKQPNIHLALNHLITLTNVFAMRGIEKVLRRMLSDEQMKDCNSFLLYLNIIPEDRESVNINPKILRELIQTVK